MSDQPGIPALPVGTKLLKTANNIRSWDNVTHYLLGLETDDALVIIPLGAEQMLLLKADVDKWVEDHGDQPIPKTKVH